MNALNESGSAPDALQMVDSTDDSLRVSELLGLILLGPNGNHVSDALWGLSRVAGCGKETRRVRGASGLL